LNLLKPSYNVETLLQRTDLRIHQRHKISSELLKRPAGIALPRRGDFFFLRQLLVLSSLAVWRPICCISCYICTTCLGNKWWW